MMSSEKNVIRVYSLRTMNVWNVLVIYNFCCFNNKIQSWSQTQRDMLSNNHVFIPVPLLVILIAWLRAKSFRYSRLLVFLPHSLIHIYTVNEVELTCDKQLYCHAECLVQLLAACNH